MTISSFSWSPQRREGTAGSDLHTISLETQEVQAGYITPSP